MDLEGEEEECEWRVDEGQGEVLFSRLEEEEEVGGKRRERSGSQAGHGQRLDVVELLDFDDNVDSAPNIGNLKLLMGVYKWRTVTEWNKDFLTKALIK